MKQGSAGNVFNRLLAIEIDLSRNELVAAQGKLDHFQIVGPAIWARRLTTTRPTNARTMRAASAADRAIIGAPSFRGAS